MGREIRRVPANWEHPTDERGRYKPQHDRSFAKAAAEWDRENAEWETGTHPDRAGHDCPYDQWAGQRPYSEYYMPDWPASERTHYQMYEDTSEGTPMSPVFATPEEVARWCADNGASMFGSSGASYEEWLSIAQGGWSPGLAIIIPHGDASPLVLPRDES